MLVCWFVGPNDNCNFVHTMLIYEFVADLVNDGYRSATQTYLNASHLSTVDPTNPDYPEGSM